MEKELAIAKNKINTEITTDEERIEELVRTNKRTIILTLESETIDRLERMHYSERMIFLDSYTRS